MHFKRIGITILLTYVVVLILALFFEVGNLGQKADRVQMTVRVASKMALQQCQVSDELFNEQETGYYISGIQSDFAEQVLDIKVIKPSGYGTSAFTSEPLMGYFTGKTYREDMFSSLYIGNEDFYSWAYRTGTLTSPFVTFRPTSLTSNSNYISEVTYVPKVARMGVDLFKESSMSDLRFAELFGFVRNDKAYGGHIVDVELGGTVDGEVVESGDEDLEVEEAEDPEEVEDPLDAKKTKKIVGSAYLDYNMTDYKNIVGSGLAGETMYFFTPQSLGLTYINEDMLSFMFINNMNLIMRAQFEGKTPANGEGLTRSPYLSVHGASDVGEGNTGGKTFVNNGIFAIETGDISRNAKGFPVYNNTINARDGGNTEIEYKVIDMFDSSNDALLKLVFGTNAATLKANSTDVDFEHYWNSFGEERVPDSKLIIVAKVKFKVDVVVPFTQVTVRSWADQLGVEYGENKVDLKREDSRDTGGTQYEYTTYFAVTP